MTDDFGRLGEETDVRVAMVEVEEPRRDFASRLGEAARDNPLSAALIAMGTVWLFAGGGRVSILGGRRGGRPIVVAPDYVTAGYARGRPMGRGADFEGSAQASRDAAQDVARRTSEAAERSAREVGASAAQVASAARSAAAEAAEAISRGVGTATERTGDALWTAREAAARGASGAWHEAEDLGRTVREALEDQPLAIAALGLAAGAGLALALPRTEAEREWMGETGETVRERLRAAAAERVGDVREGAEAALSRAVRDARAHGLSEDAVKASIEEFTAKIQKVALAARDAAEDEIEGSGKGGAGKGAS